MKLYRFYLDDNALVRDILDVEEKPKTYTIIGCDWRQRIAKEDIGAVDCRGRVHLLEDDIKKAVRILKEYHICQKTKHEVYHNQIIENYNKTMAVLDIAEKECIVCKTSR